MAVTRSKSIILAMFLCLAFFETSYSQLHKTEISLASNLDQAICFDA